MLKLAAIVILGATLFDGSGRAPVKDSVVVIEGDRIVAVGRRGQVKIPRDARVIDARGMVVSPGFIDAHNHSDRGFRNRSYRQLHRCRRALPLSWWDRTVARHFLSASFSPTWIRIRSL